MTTRRWFLGSAAAFVSLVRAADGHATPQAMQDLVRTIVSEGNLQRGRVTLDVPPLVENGNAVPLTVAVDSPMQERDHVKAIHVVNQKNPQPHVISIALGPRAGRAKVSTRIKLADAQQIMAIAELNDGSFWYETADVVVTIAACVEDVN